MKIRVLLLMFSMNCAAFAQSSPSYILAFDVFDSGGGGPNPPASASYRAHSIVGQAAALHMSTGATHRLSSGGECMFCEVFSVTSVSVAVLPSVMQLYQNFPNPFNPATTIRYVLMKSAHVEVVITNLLGERIEVLVNERQAPGEYELLYDSYDLKSGVYVYSLLTEHGMLSRRMVVLK